MGIGEELKVVTPSCIPLVCGYLERAPEKSETYLRVREVLRRDNESGLDEPGCVAKLGEKRGHESHARSYPVAYILDGAGRDIASLLV